MELWVVFQERCVLGVWTLQDCGWWPKPKYPASSLSHGPRAAWPCVGALCNLRECDQQSCCLSDLPLLWPHSCWEANLFNLEQVAVGGWVPIAKAAPEQLGQPVPGQPWVV